MVHVVLAGGSGGVGREVLDVLQQTGKHQLTVFTRSEAPDLVTQGVQVVKVDYSDKNSLKEHLQGVHTVLSFVVTATDPEGKVQKVLIDASIEAGVKRFAPSEWATRSNSGSSGYKGKDAVHEYLQEVNKDKKVIEYTLFQPGMFLNYFSFPYPSTKHMKIFGLHYDLKNRRAILPAEGDFPVTFTSLQDLTKIVAEAIDYEGEWPERGGISGTQTTNSEFIKLIESIRGPLKIETVPKADLEAGKVNTSWIPEIDHPSIPAEAKGEALNRAMVAQFLTASLTGAWSVTDEWNKLLPHLKPTKAEDFLREIWEGKE